MVKNQKNRNTVLEYVLLTHMLFQKKGKYMAKTKSSTRGVQNKKIVVVKPYKKSDGTKVSGHRRSTPN